MWVLVKHKQYKRYKHSCKRRQHFSNPVAGWIPYTWTSNQIIPELLEWGGKDQSRISKIKAWSVLELSSNLGREYSGTKDRQLADKSAST